MDKSRGTFKLEKLMVSNDRWFPLPSPNLISVFIRERGVFKGVIISKFPTCILYGAGSILLSGREMRDYEKRGHTCIVKQNYGNIDMDMIMVFVVKLALV